VNLSPEREKKRSEVQTCSEENPFHIFQLIKERRSCSYSQPRWEITMATVTSHMLRVSPRRSPPTRQAASGVFLRSRFHPAGRSTGVFWVTHTHTHTYTHTHTHTHTHTYTHTHTHTHTHTERMLLVFPGDGHSDDGFNIINTFEGNEVIAADDRNM